MLHGFREDRSIHRGFFQHPPTDFATWLNGNPLTFSFDSVEVVVDRANSPRFFPVLQLGGNKDLQMHARLIDAPFNAKTFSLNNRGANRKLIENVASDVYRVVRLAEIAAKRLRAMIFQPSDPTNQLCDFVVILPVNSTTLCFLFVEMKDSAQTECGEKLTDDLETSELLLKPVAKALKKLGVEVCCTVLVCCGRNEVTPP
jgi:hypothetical protein